MQTIGVIHILVGWGSSIILSSVEKRCRLQMEGDLENVWWVPLTWSMTLTKKYKRMCEVNDAKIHIFAVPKTSRKSSQVTTKSC